MSSTNKTSLGLNKWEASDKPVRQDFVNDNVIIDEKIAKLNSDLVNRLIYVNGFLSVPNSNIRVVVGQISVNVPANSESFVINASLLTANKLTNGENIIGINWYSIDHTSIFPIGFRLSSSNQVAVYINKPAGAPFDLNLRYVTYYFL